MRSSFTLIRQLYTKNCGTACLAMVCKAFGLSYSIGQLEQICSPSKEGMSLKGIADAAAHIGFATKAGRISIERLKEAPLPAILHWNQNHFVVLYRISRNGTRFHIADPGKGKYCCSKPNLQQHWISMGNGTDGNSQSGNIGIGLFFEPTSRILRPLQENQQSPERSFMFLWKYIKEYRRHFFQIIFGMLLGCILQLIMPFLTQSIVDIGIHHEDIGFIWLILVGELMIVAGGTLTDFIRHRLLMHISMRVNISLVSDFLIKLLKLPMGFFDTKLLGDLLQRMADHSRVQSFMTGQVLGIFFSLLSFFIFGLVLMLYNYLIFVVFLIGSIAYGLWIALFLPKRKAIDYELFEQQAKNQNKTYQLLTTIQEIKLQNCEQRRRHEWEDLQADLFVTQMKSLRLDQNREAGAVCINEINNILITVMAASAVINGKMTLGAMLAIQYIIGQLNSPVKQLLSIFYSVQDVKISLERINDIHRRPEEWTPVTWRCSIDGDKSIQLKDLDFRYDQHSPTKTLSQININIPKGSVTAIVGASGSGKTTLVKLILGYYPPEQGEIMIGGRPMAEYDLKWWRQQCGVVLQEGVIFSESIERNIAVGDTPVDKTRLLKAAKTANILSYIDKLPLGFNTLIGRDGIGLSLGQRQRILIARAIYKDPAFIFLDEATNSLDARNEKEIVEKLREFYKGRTVIIVAHRLSTVREADNIIVLDEGRIVESGTHEQLTMLKGVYYTLIKNQLELGS